MRFIKVDPDLTDRDGRYTVMISSNFRRRALSIKQGTMPSQISTGVAIPLISDEFMGLSRFSTKQRYKMGRNRQNPT